MFVPFVYIFSLTGHKEEYAVSEESRWMGWCVCVTGWREVKSEKFLNCGRSGMVTLAIKDWTNPSWLSWLVNSACCLCLTVLSSGVLNFDRCEAGLAGLEEERKARLRDSGKFV